MQIVPHGLMISPEFLKHHLKFWEWMEFLLPYFSEILLGPQCAEHFRKHESGAGFLQRPIKDKWTTHNRKKFTGPKKPHVKETPSHAPSLVGWDHKCKWDSRSWKRGLSIDSIVLASEIDNEGNIAILGLQSANSVERLGLSSNKKFLSPKSGTETKASIPPRIEKIIPTCLKGIILLSGAKGTCGSQHRPVVPISISRFLLVSRLLQFLLMFQIPPPLLPDTCSLKTPGSFPHCFFLFSQETA